VKKISNLLKAGECEIILLLLLLGSVLILQPSIHGNDGVQNYAYLHSLLFDHDLDFTNEYEHYISKSAQWFDFKKIDLNRDPVTGLPVNLYGVGSSLMWAPWILSFHLAGIITGSLTGAHYNPNGYGRLYESAISLASWFYAAAGLWLCFRILIANSRESSERWNGLFAVLAIWLASPLFFYMFLHPSMSHAISFFLSTLLFWLYLRANRPLHWMGLGAVAALLIMTRYQDAILLSLIASGELLGLRKSFTSGAVRARLRNYLLFLVTLAICFVPQLVAWKILQGSAFSGPRGYIQQGELRPWYPQHFLQVLFSSRHGLFYWHPLLLAGFTGLLMGGREQKLKLVCLIAFCSELWVISCWSIWWGGASFGHRMFISALPFLATGFYFIGGKTPKIISIPLLLFFIFWNFGYVLQYGTGMIPRQENVSLQTLVRNNVIEVPKLFWNRIVK
jgi:hypothetical protein